MDHSSDRNGGPKNKQTTTIIAAILVILGILIVAQFATQREPKDVPTRTDDGQQVETAEEEVLPPPLITDFETPDNFNDVDEAEDVINATQGKPTSGPTSERIVYGVVTDETEMDIRYFATSTYNQRQDENFVGVYRYNVNSNRWWRVYKVTYKADEGEPLRTIHVLGKEGRNLILLISPLDQELGPCDSVWIPQGEAELVLLNMDDAYGGFSPYELSQERLQIEQHNMEECRLSEDV